MKALRMRSDGALFSFSALHVCATVTGFSGILLLILRVFLFLVFPGILLSSVSLVSLRWITTFVQPRPFSVHSVRI